MAFARVHEYGSKYAFAAKRNKGRAAGHGEDVKNRSRERDDMKKEQLMELGLGEDVAKKVLEINGADIENAKKPLMERAVAAEAERDELQACLDETGKTLRGFEGFDPQAMRQQLADTQQALQDARDTHAAELAARDSRAETERYLAGRPFVNDITRAHFAGAIEAALADPAGAGRTRQEILDALVTDGAGGVTPGIFAEENPNRLLETPPSGRVEAGEAFPFIFTPINR